MLKAISFIVIVFMICFISYLNLGKFLDATVEPEKVDLLVCLGGGDYKTRIEKTLELYSDGFLNSNTIVLTGYVNSKREVQKGIVEDKRVTYIKISDDNDLNIVLNKNLRNTAEEMKYIKEYMLKNNFKSVTFITEPPHSRRVILLSKIISIDGDENLSINVMGSDFKDWNTSYYYENKNAKNYALTEVLKIIYGLFMYGFLDKFGLLEWFEVEFQEEIENSRKSLTKGMYFIAS